MLFVEEIRKKLDTHTAVPLWPDAGIALGLTRGHAYRGAISRDIKVIRTGRLKRVPTSWLRQQLGPDEPLSHVSGS
jgi:hypothetical protein